MGQLYDQGRPKALPGSITPRARWTAGGDIAKAAAAIDGDIATAAVTSHNPYDNATIDIDLGKVCVFNFVVIDHGVNEFGFCRQVTLLTSVDNKRFTQVYTGCGTRRLTNLCLLKPVLARYIRIQASIPGPQPWSVAEVYVK